MIFLCTGDILRRFTKDAENVMTKIEDEKTLPEEEHDKQVISTLL